jgi:mono/diheme cytochrome c family protein
MRFDIDFQDRRPARRGAEARGHVRSSRPALLVWGLALLVGACGGGDGGASPPEGAAEGAEPPAARRPADAAPLPAWKVEAPIYTGAQAERGAEIFGGICSTCHTIEDFRSPVFHRNWGGGTVADLFDFASGAMPKDNPGALPPEDYAAVLSFFFRENGLAAGDVALPVELRALRTIRLELNDAEQDGR